MHHAHRLLLAALVCIGLIGCTDSDLPDRVLDADMLDMVVEAQDMLVAEDLDGADEGLARDMQVAPEDMADDASEDADMGSEADMAEDMPGDMGGRYARSPCERSNAIVSCPNEEELFFPVFVPREVQWQVPNGDAPEGGWPVVILFQGSLFTPEYGWSAAVLSPFGGFYQAQLIDELLAAGFAVLTPEALGNGSTFWQTNVPPFSVAWTTSNDHFFMLDLFEAIEDGTFGELDPEKMYAAGLSSGGYMTSRMAVSYPGRFKALAIHSASYATCGGAACVVPSELPEDHPPTLFLHGSLDNIVPEFTMEPYFDRLTAQGVPTRKVTNALLAHQWLPEAPVDITAWFEMH